MAFCGVVKSLRSTILHRNQKNNNATGNFSISRTLYFKFHLSSNKRTPFSVAANKKFNLRSFPAARKVNYTHLQLQLFASYFLKPHNKKDLHWSWPSSLVFFMSETGARNRRLRTMHARFALSQAQCEWWRWLHTADIRQSTYSLMRFFTLVFVLFAGRLAVFMLGLFTLIVGIVLSSIPWVDYFIYKVSQ